MSPMPSRWFRCCFTGLSHGLVLLVGVLLALPAGQLNSLAAQPVPTQQGTAPQTDARKLAYAPETEALVSITGAPYACEAGKAGRYGCQAIDLLSFLSHDRLGGFFDADTLRVSANDIWGWTDPETGREYVLLGRSDGVVFLDIADPTNPVVVGELLSHTRSSLWRDVKVVNDHAVIVSEAAGHGMQVFDLTRLRDVTAPPVVFEATAHYDGFGNAHNIVANDATDRVYAVGTGGTGRGGTNPCPMGLHMIDMQNPAAPTFAGCHQSSLPRYAGSTAGYTHDAQCVVYQGPDAEHQGKEICLGANETGVGIVDVSDPAVPVELSTATYPTAAYVHQGWLTEDQRYFFQNDELDEGRRNAPTRTLIWDVEDLDDPVLAGEFVNTTPAIDHNLYVRGPYVFQANYRSGLRILDISDPEDPQEVGFFDTVPADDNRGYSGAWSVYPYFESGVVAISSIGEGLFLVQPEGLQASQVGTDPDEVPATFRLAEAYPNPFNPQATFDLAVYDAQPVLVAVYDAQGREVARLHDGLLPTGTHTFRFDAAGLPSGIYLYRAQSATRTETRTMTLVK